VPKKAAAATLGVSRQMLDIYLKGQAMPGPDVILRAMKAWGFPLSYRGREVTSSLLAKPTTNGRNKTAEQLLLPLRDAIDSLSEGNLAVKIASRQADRIDLQVSIKFVS
jgi:transcriptional regulator with XRE-family HTH domain